MNNKKEEFLRRVKNTFLDWEKLGFCPEAVALNENIGTAYFGITNPHFFTGDLNAELVLIHLNPKRNMDKQTKSYSRYNSAEAGFQSFEHYLNHYINFGKNHYGEDSKRNHKSPFDHKQIRFIRPLEVLPLNSPDKFENLVNVIDKKLQLELIPFGSNDFNFKKIGISNLRPYINTILDMIATAPRKYIIFCGRVFEDLLQDYIIEKNKIVFRLIKKNGQETKDTFEVINLKIQSEGSSFTCCIAPQFAKQGFPVEAYGRKVKEVYGVF
jgi:hypothetical protein